MRSDLSVQHPLNPSPHIPHLERNKETVCLGANANDCGPGPHIQVAPNSAFRPGVTFMIFFFFIVTEQRKFYIKVLFKYIGGSPVGQVTAKREISAGGLRYCLRVFLASGLVEASALLIRFKMAYLIVTRTLGHTRWTVDICLVAKIAQGSSASDLQPSCLPYQCSDRSALVEG